ncbi:MAG TPA: LPS export ABC transporter ATP-binding protein [Gemmatimonadaceae bacterium]|nr:LPS export ABC transporter ATP-binding protein [Gemmatimonadaceae bacterium]
MIDQPTPPDEELPARIRALIEHFAPHDRSPVMAMHALFAAADIGTGAARFDEVAVIYREDHLLLEKAAGRDAERAAGELSLDQVRAHLRDTLLPRLVADGVVTLPAGGLDTPGARIQVVSGVWGDVKDRREQVAAEVRRRTTEVVRVQTGRVPVFTPTTQAKLTGRLEARGLFKTYKKRSVVNDVALHLRQGEIVGLLGPNGAGKTTTFYMIVGLIQPQSGKIVLDGDDITAMPMFKRAQRGIGYLSQEPSIFRKLSVEENILAILETLGLSKAEKATRLEKLLDELSIKHLRKSKAYALSGGERRRLEITRALVTNPKFMMLDEPFAGVDPIAVHDIQTIVSGLRHRGIGVLISDHNVEQTLDIVDRAYIMFDGQVKVSGTVRELVFDDTVAELYLGPTLAARLRQRFARDEDKAGAA